MSGKIVLITGVTRGLGPAMVEEFARLNHTVLGCGRSKREIDQLRRRYGAPHDFYVVDVASDEDVKSWASLLLTTHGTPDLILNNAAVINRGASLWEISAREFSQVLDTNVKGLANIIRHFVPEMVRRKRGIIVNFSSSWGRSAGPELAPYCASKWAVEGLTLALAQELPSGMAAVSYNPGVINTEMLQSFLGKSAASYRSPVEWAKTAVPFLLKLGPGDNGKQLEAPEA
ncbi:MAG TPA: SDR family oxidoreductase [Candidatus Sulfotelmatobacter sp.]|nr:SDR family oxidoreductase [Candidatus Sulfotelmatobacter sp.]HWI59625.1 SDR family oxidoreductase [Bacillota bacterium]